METVAAAYTLAVVTDRLVGLCGSDRSLEDRQAKRRVCSTRVGGSGRQNKVAD